MYTADIDIGGTFTDGFFTRGDDARRSKVLTTPHDLTECFLGCLREGAAQFEVSLREFLRANVVVRLSTTLGTNTLIQRRGPKIGLLVSRGHERDLYGPEGQDAAVLDLILRPEMVRGITEETAADGSSVKIPSSAEVLEAVRELIDLGARMIAVSFKGSWRNPVHEQEVRRIARERYPEHYLRSIPLQLAHEVSAATDDHSRTNAVALNAYLHGQLARGLFRAEDRAREQSLTHPLLVVHASGGCARVAKTVAVQTLSSGPAVAISGATALANQLGLQRVVTADMGGTSLDVAILDGGAPRLVDRPHVAGIELGVPMIETTSIGAGGGSIAKIVDGRIEVGPESAGSAPGPACYDKGGMEPTVTDANLVLGFLDPDRFLSGRMKLNRKRSEDALTRRLARLLDRSAEDVAAEVRARVDDRMAADIGHRLRERGADPAEFTLFAFGGGGPLHGCAIAERVGIKRVVGFPFGSVFSAFGSSTVDVRHRYQRSLAVRATDADASSRLSSALADLRRQAALDMRGEGFAPAEVDYQITLVLHSFDGDGQVDAPADAHDGGVDVRAVLEDLQRSGTHLDTRDLEVRGLILDARAGIPHWLPEAAESIEPHAPEARETRTVRWSGQEQAVDTPLFDLATLLPGARFHGPALVESTDTLYAVPAGWEAQIDPRGNVVMER